MWTKCGQKCVRVKSAHALTRAKRSQSLHKAWPEGRRSRRFNRLSIGCSPPPSIKKQACLPSRPCPADLRFQRTSRLHTLSKDRLDSGSPILARRRWDQCGGVGDSRSRDCNRYKRFGRPASGTSLPGSPCRPEHRNGLRMSERVLHHWTR